MTDAPHLDTARACAAELARLHERLAYLPAKWAKKSSELHVLEQKLEAAEAVAFLEADGGTATERKAQAVKALQDNPDTKTLAEDVARLRGEVEGLRRVFSIYDRQSSITQSLLSYHKEEGRYE
jgi:hypothetical protein